MWLHGALSKWDNEGRTDIYYKEPHKGGIWTVRKVCDVMKVPRTELEVGIDQDIPSSVRISRSKGFSETQFQMNPNRVWLSKLINRSTIELPGFLIKSDLAGDRYINLEILTEAPKETPELFLISQWGAARQCLRNMARTAVEERLITAYGQIDYKMAEGIANKMFPMDEEGYKEPDTSKWMSGFIRLYRAAMED